MGQSVDLHSTQGTHYTLRDSMDATHTHTRSLSTIQRTPAHYICMAIKFIDTYRNLFAILPLSISLEQQQLCSYWVLHREIKWCHWVCKWPVTTIIKKNEKWPSFSPSQNARRNKNKIKLRMKQMQWTVCEIKCILSNARSEVPAIFKLNGVNMAQWFVFGADPISWCIYITFSFSFSSCTGRCLLVHVRNITKAKHPRVMCDFNLSLLQILRETN